MSNSVKAAIFFHLGFFWCLPISIIIWLIFGILYLFKQVEEVYWCEDLVVIWDIKNDSWLDRNFLSGKGWAGFSFGCNVIVVDKDGERWKRTLRHEKEHCYQQYKYGVFMPVLYILDTLRIYLFCPDLHSYYSNVFEVGARIAAGQPEIIPRDQWREGPEDRWAWW